MTSEQLHQLIEKASLQFDEQCQQRHEFGAQKYGPINFAQVDTLEMAMEEIVDLANYARYTFIRLALLRESAESFDQGLTLGKEAFLSNKRSSS